MLGQVLVEQLIREQNQAPYVVCAAADLVPAKVKMYIFYGMPKKTKLKTIFAPLCGKSPEAVMAPAVADAHKLGYDKLYRLLLDHVSQCRRPI